jgi:hypothetical protein
LDDQEAEVHLGVFHDLQGLPLGIEDPELFAHVREDHKNREGLGVSTGGIKKLYSGQMFKKSKSKKFCKKIRKLRKNSVTPKKDPKNFQPKKKFKLFF